MIKIEEKQQVWFEHVKNCESSGLTQPEFCRKNNLSMNTFAYYRGQYLSQQKVPAKASNPFVEIQFPGAMNIEPFSLSFPNGIKLCLPQQFDDKRLIKLIEVLRTC
jgi:hypothetical protein